MAESGPSNLNQTIVNSRCVLFVGAGASAPLEMLPTAPFLKLLETELLKSMVDSEKLMPQTTSVNLDNWIKDFFNQAGRYHESKTPDSEMVLDYLEHLTESCEELKSLPQLFAELAGYAGSPNLHGDWSAVFSRAKGYIQEIIVKHYSSVKGRKALDLSSGPHHQDSGEAKIRESTAGVSRKPSSDGKARGSSSKHLCGLTAWNT